MSYSRIRSERMAVAKSKGRHTKKQWLDMLEFFEYTCVRCLGDNGSNIEKDHIIPIYQGGSDGLDNIQPLCSRCNCQKGPETIDWRPQGADWLKKELPEFYTQKIST